MLSSVARAVKSGVLLLAASTAGSRAAASMCAQVDDWKAAKSIYEFSAKDIDGNEVSLERYRGLVCIIVNVASK